MKRLFTTLLQELDSGHSAVLCGIVAPRGVGEDAGTG